MVNLQLGAVYLWSYVYNIVRVSSRSIKDVPISKSSRESSSSDAGGSTEPLLSSTESTPPGHDADEYVLPQTILDGKAQVLQYFFFLFVPYMIHSFLGEYCSTLFTNLELLMFFIFLNSMAGGCSSKSRVKTTFGDAV